MLKHSLYSIFKFKCPRCNKGDFFESNNPYNLKKAGDIKESCSHCNLKYTPELGFYIGVMYVSYGLGIALFVLVWVATMVLHPNYTSMQLIGLLFLSMVLSGPYLYALSKTIWANMFYHYDEEFAKSNKNEK